MKVIPSTGPSRTRRTKALALGCALMIVVMLVSQLYGYDDFAVTLSALLPFSDQPLAQLLAASTVIVELFALPYLLGMYLSPLMRVLSAACAGGAAGFWLITAFTNAHALNSGLFSTTLQLAGGIVPALWSLLLVGLYLAVVAADSKFRHDTTT